MSYSFWPHELKHTRHFLPYTISWNLLRLMSIKSVVLSRSDTIQQSHPVLALSPLALSLSQNQSLFKWVGFLQQAAKVLKLQHQSFQWILRLDFLYDTLVWSPCSPGTLKSVPQHHNTKASILGYPAFFQVHLPHSYVTTGKTIALTIQIFVSKVMSLVSAF